MSIPMWLCPSVESLAGALEIFTLCNCEEDLTKKVHLIADKFVEGGLISLGVASQV